VLADERNAAARLAFLEEQCEIAEAQEFRSILQAVNANA
jgi:hypothetical protein